jgi:uncharacterized protein (TIGR03084 family)
MERSPVVSLQALLDDLSDETTTLESILNDLRPAQWSLATPAEGWSIGDQVTHLAYFDEAATLAAMDEDGFRRQAGDLGSRGPDFSAWVADQYRSMDWRDQHEWFRRARTRLIATFEPLDVKAAIPWYGPPMSASSCVSARLMETWAHGQDVADALAIAYPQSLRLSHIAHLGVRTIGFSFLVHGVAAPDVPVRVDLEAPDGSRWTWGEPESSERVTGQAVDFCLVVTQRRHVRETGLDVRGGIAAQWLSLAQAFAGPPTFARAALGSG